MAKKDEVRNALTKKEAGQESVKDHKMVVAAKVKKERVKLTPPPPPPTKIGEVANPIIGKRSLKRALAVAIVSACTVHHKDGTKTTDETKAGLLIRQSGICFKSGYTEEKATEPLTQSEWAGRPYTRFVTNTPEGKAYEQKHPEKVKECVPFAKALKKAMEEEEERQAQLQKEKDTKEKESKPDEAPAAEATAPATA